MQQEVFVRGEEAGVLRNPQDSKLTAWFKLNQEDATARQFLYTEIPQHYVWDAPNKKWLRRKTNTGERVITRLYAVNPKNTESSYLRLLLLHTPGALSYEYLKTYHSHIYATYRDVCVARGFTASDDEWRMTMDEATQTKIPKNIRQLFAFIVALYTPTDVRQLWN